MDYTILNKKCNQVFYLSGELSKLVDKNGILLLVGVELRKLGNFYGDIFCYINHKKRTKYNSRSSIIMKNYVLENIECKFNNHSVDLPIPTNSKLIQYLNTKTTSIKFNEKKRNYNNFGKFGSYSVLVRNYNTKNITILYKKTDKAIVLSRKRSLQFVNSNL